MKKKIIRETRGRKGLMVSIKLNVYTEAMPESDQGQPKSPVRPEHPKRFVNELLPYVSRVPPHHTLNFNTFSKHGASASALDSGPQLHPGVWVPCGEIYLQIDPDLDQQTPRLGREAPGGLVQTRSRSILDASTSGPTHNTIVPDKQHHQQHRR
ncbi:hypothetical protein RRG08_044743 [Elysia crispata]|uniref:Uncharacterized protein n=1 Tax=Elysia crispata TaxID=231223 RepID=A0AAE0ZHR6_9GAST|nr:hypothetical protein RRG08_044743 [Elysia crispata]